jgi:putative MFS transporter
MDAVSKKAWLHKSNSLGDSTPRQTSREETMHAGEFPGFTADSGERLDRLSLSRYHIWLLTLVGAGMFLDGFELYLTAGVLGALTKNGWSTMSLNATFVSVTFLGMVVGAWTAGILGDRFGRRFTYQFNLLLFGLAAIGAFFAPTMQWLIALRFIMGIGLGAEVVVGYAMLTEFMPAAIRGRMVGWLAVITNSSLIASILLSMWIIPNFGWRYMFLLVGIGSLIVWLIRKSMPESPRWLESQNRIQEADAIVSRIEGRMPGTYRPVTRPARVAVADQAKVPVWMVFAPALFRSTLIGILINVVIGFSLYGFISWLPTFFVRQGFTVVASMQWTLVMSLGAPFGAVIGLYLSDRAGRRPTIVAVSVAAALFGTVYPLVGNGVLLMIVGFCLFTTIYILLAVAFAIYIPELFPTVLRMRGTGVCSVVGRLVTASVQFIIIELFAWGGIAAVVGTLSGLLLLLAVVVGFFGIETAQRSLEDISVEPEIREALVPSIAQAKQARG